MERIVGWFIIAATALMILALGYYLYRTAEQRGWFEVKASYYTYSDTGTGLAVGDPVQLMGFNIGRITRIAPPPPWGKGSERNVRIDFVVLGTNYDYIRAGGMSHAKFVDVSFLGKRQLNITKEGTNGCVTYLNFPVKQMTLQEIKSSPHLAKLRLGEEIYRGTNLAIKRYASLSNNVEELAGLGLSNVWALDLTSRNKEITAVWNDQGPEPHYEPFVGTNIYCLPPEESPALGDRLQNVVAQIEAALPNFLALTNQIAATLSNSVQLTSNLNAVAAGVRPAVSNVAVITANLRDPHGSLGEWLIPTNLNLQIAATLLNANGTLTNVNLAITNVNTNLAAMFQEVGSSLDNVADLTSNLNHQVQVNSNMLAEVSKIIVDSDNFIQGLKHHWLLRSAFKPAKTNAPPRK